ncbi:MAG TPA: phosphomannomutase CpsG [Spirochaetales bacterium]|nr:phosphomannomutase CpsG [Spirochaetales bacterium]HQK33842.1 phosphomannomutase CpsG [Spirochaetales bacterium]
MSKSIAEKLASCFKAYDIRGFYPEDIDETLAYAIGLAYANEFNPKTVVVGYDARFESSKIHASLIDGLQDGGAHVINIGLCGTEEVYFSTFYYQYDGGIMVTASHNPIGHTGFKMVRAHSVPVNNENGLEAIKKKILENSLHKTKRGTVQEKNVKDDYVAYLLRYVDVEKIRPLRILFNCGNGSAGPLLKKLVAQLPIDPVFVLENPDGNFPFGIPNPLLPENRSFTVQAIQQQTIDFAVAWDGDFDRCFFYDERGAFIEGYYLVGLLASVLLQKFPGAKIIHDPRLMWNTIELVKQHGGIPVLSKTGHAFIKEKMRQEDAVYGGEMSAHHYFKDFAYCDSGMIPWLLILQLVSVSGKSLSQLIAERVALFPCSGEINYTVQNADKIINTIKEQYKDIAISFNEIDGISMEFSDWRFNIRKSNTEPLLRLNLETRSNPRLVKEKVSELEKIINGIG